MAPSATQVQAQHGGNSQALLDAQLELWHHTFGFVKSMALKSALDLRVADAIHHHGGAATLTQIATKVKLHPSKTPCLRRLMRVLTVTGVFSVVEHPAGDGGEHLYGLTPASRLLVVDSRSVAPFVTLMLDNVFTSPFLGLGAWFQLDSPPDHQSLFEMTHGQTLWDLGENIPTFSTLFNEGMVSDSSFVMDIVVKECGDVFQGVTSLIDVAGGLGGAAQAIAKAFPHIKCSVLDLPQVVANAPANSDVEYVAGNMFESIPPANAIFLKWVLHDWGDAECVKILKSCKEAIPSKAAGGKVVILDMVVGARSPNLKHRETHVLFDLFIMFINGSERNEQEWKKIISEAGFSGYKIIPVLGVRSIIEVYP
ncbi:hypothetical protein ACP70R_034078 [Stipagrostis hirtigluma subsp. patula]